MLNLRSALKKRKTLMFIVCSACVLLLLQFRAGSYQSAQRERFIDDVTYSYRECPIKIVGVETSKHQVALGKPFLGDDDWMKGLTIRIENKSGKVITHVGIAIHFDPPADHADQVGALWEIWYGVSPFYFKPDEPIPPPLVRTVQPGEIEPIALSATEYDAMMAFLRYIQFPSSVERLNMNVSTIGFADGTAWSGQLFRRDPSGPHGWTPADKRQGSARKRATLSSPFLLVSYNKDDLFGWKVSPSPMRRAEAPLRTSRSLDAVPCGVAVEAARNCPNQPSGCKYDYVNDFSASQYPTDAVQNLRVACYIVPPNSTTKVYGCAIRLMMIPFRPKLNVHQQ